MKDTSDRNALNDPYDAAMCSVRLFDLLNDVFVFDLLVRV